MQASAKAKIVNLAANAGVLLLFIPYGSMLWLPRGILAIANVAGSYLDSRIAVARGATFIRVVFLLVVVALIAKLGVEVWNEEDRTGPHRRALNDRGKHSGRRNPEVL